MERLTTAMSTAEAVSVGYAAGVQAHYFGGVTPGAEHVAQHLVGTALKDEPEDVKRLRHYLEHEVRGRRGRRLEGPLRRAFAARVIRWFGVRHHSPAARGSCASWCCASGRTRS